MAGVIIAKAKGDRVSAHEAAYDHADMFKQLLESFGPTMLTMGAVADGQVLTRSGSTIIGTAGGGSGLSNLEGGAPDSVYGAVSPIDGGGP